MGLKKYYLSFSILSSARRASGFSHGKVLLAGRIAV
jgi:hypothetical protein